MEESGKENWRVGEDILLRIGLLVQSDTTLVVEKFRHEMYQVWVFQGRTWARDFDRCCLNGQR